MSLSMQVSPISVCTRTLQINAFAGNNSDWDDVEWTFRIFQGQPLTVFAYSGSITANKEFGQINFRGEDLVTLPMNREGHAQVGGRLRPTCFSCGCVIWHHI